MCFLWSHSGGVQGEPEEARGVHPRPGRSAPPARGYPGADCPSCAGNQELQQVSDTQFKELTAHILLFLRAGTCQTCCTSFFLQARITVICWAFPD